MRERLRRAGQQVRAGHSAAGAPWRGLDQRQSPVLPDPQQRDVRRDPDQPRRPRATRPGPTGAELDAVCERLRDDLLALSNDETGRPVIDEVIRTSDVYRRGAIDALPDLCARWTRGAPIRAVRSPKIGTVRVGSRATPGRPPGAGTPPGARPIDHAWAARRERPDHRHPHHDRRAARGRGWTTSTASPWKPSPVWQPRHRRARGRQPGAALAARSPRAGDALHPPAAAGGVHPVPRRQHEQVGPRPRCRGAASGACGIGSRGRGEHRTARTGRTGGPPRAARSRCALTASAAKQISWPAS